MWIRVLIFAPLATFPEAGRGGENAMGLRKSG